MGIAIGSMEHSGGTGMHKKNPGFSKILQRETWKDRKKILQINEVTLHCFFHYSANFGFNHLYKILL